MNLLLSCSQLIYDNTQQSFLEAFLDVFSCITLTLRNKWYKVSHQISKSCSKMWCLLKMHFIYNNTQLLLQVRAKDLIHTKMHTSLNAFFCLHESSMGKEVTSTIAEHHEKLLLLWNLSIPDADFSCHPARFTMSTEEDHQGVVAYCSLWLKDCRNYWNVADFSIVGNAQNFPCLQNLCLS